MEEKRDFVEKMRLDIRGNTADLLAERIRSLVISGEIPAGYTFPNETSFCEQLGVSRSTLREAYKALESTGFIRRVRRTGTVVNDFSDISKAAPLSTSLIMSDYEELMEFRVMIEAELARLAAQRATAEHIARMAGFLENMRSGDLKNMRDGDLENLTYYDTLFHMEIAKASGNRILVSTMENAKDLFQEGIYEAFQMDTEANVREALLLHTQILDAIRKRDSEAAYALMRQHIGSVGRRMESGKK